MKRTKRIAALLLSWILLFLTSNISLFADQSTIAREDKTILSKPLQEILQQNNSDEKITVSVWFADVDTSDVKSLAMRVSGFLSRTPELNLSDVKTALDVHSFIHVSRYAPEVIIRANKTEIEQLSKIKSVESIDYIAEDLVLSSTQASDTQTMISNAVVNVPAVHNSSAYGYTGIGVNIGIYDAGLPSDSVMSSLNTVAYLGNSSDAHAESTTKTLASVAPNANYYFIGNTGSPNMRENIEWLLDQNVDIINISMSLGDGSRNQYGNTAKYMDHVAYIHYVHGPCCIHPLCKCRHRSRKRRNKRRQYRNFRRKHGI